MTISQAQQPDLSCRVGDVYGAYLSNEAKGESFYGGKTVKLIGNYSTMAKDTTGRYVLFIQGYGNTKAKDTRGS